MSQKIGEKTNQAYLHEWIADLHLVLARQDEAEIHFRQALGLYLEVSEMNRYGRVLPKLSRVHVMGGDFAGSLSLCQDALRIGESRNEKQIIADAYFGLADLYFRSREWHQSRSYAQTAVGLYEDLGDQNRANKLSYMVIACKTYLGLLQEAEKEAQELLNILTDPENAYDNIFNVIQIRTLIGMITFKQENYGAAETHWQEAFQLNTLIGSQEAALPLRNNLGKAYTRMGEWEEAKLMFIEALPYYKKFGNIYGWGNCMDNLADLYEAQKDYASCRETLQEALDYLEPFQDQSHIRELCQMIRERLERLSTKPFLE
jgi:tetratricopeptide (TPR) repeat protein